MALRIRLLGALFISASGSRMLTTLLGVRLHVSWPEGSVTKVADPRKAWSGKGQEVTDEHATSNYKGLHWAMNCHLELV